MKLIRTLTTSFAFFAFIQFPALAQTSDSDCRDCHSGTSVAKTAHGNVRCQSCHSDAFSGHPAKLRKVDCGRCHTASKEFQASDHSKAITSYVKSNGQNLCQQCHEKEPHGILNRKDAKSKVHRANIAKTCAECHEKKEVMAKFQHKLHPLRSYELTVHGKSFTQGNTEAATCSDCHGGHNNQYRGNRDSMLAGHNVAKTCGKCHESEQKAYEKSVHGMAALKDVREAPLCITCHGEHNIHSVSSKESDVYKTSISTNCSSCHASERIARKFNFPLDRLDSYRSSFHGTMDRYGSLQVANCASCHGAHEILPSSNPESTVSAKNLPKTCGKCHPGAGANLSVGNIHMNPAYAEGGLVYWVRIVYIYLIVMIIGFMLFHNFIDFRKKVSRRYRAAVLEGEFPRLNRLERVQHVLLALSFIGLAWTGFAIAYPDSVVAMPFRLWAGGAMFRWWAHRFLAVVMTVTSFIHIYYVLFTPKGRTEIRNFIPNFKDYKDLCGLIAYNLKLSDTRPAFGRVSYIEKMEYLALVWGTVVMVITGAILMLDNLALKYLPMSVINVATIVHLYEAILATAAIVVWHFYFVIFDPDEYPMNWTWYTGRLTKHQQESMHGGELEEPPISSPEAPEK